MKKQEANAIEARELALYAVNTADLYRQRAQPIIANLARKIAAGNVYDPQFALKAWRYLADDAAAMYRREFSMVGGFVPATRDMAAAEIAAHYADKLRDTSALLAIDRANARLWTLAEIRHANKQAGRYFFSRQTMRCFGDTMASFKVRCRDGRIYLERVRPMRDRDGRNMGGVGQLREFHPETGEIGVPIREQDAA